MPFFSLWKASLELRVHYVRLVAPAHALNSNIIDMKHVSKHSSTTHDSPNMPYQEEQKTPRPPIYSVTFQRRNSVMERRNVPGSGKGDLENCALKDAYPHPHPYPIHIPLRAYLQQPLLSNRTDCLLNRYYRSHLELNFSVKTLYRLC
jgi:hypothetical protein